MTRIGLLLLTFALFMLMPARVWAQADERDDRPTAEALFAAGREALRQGNYRAAYKMFAESNRLDPAVGTVLNLAICDEHLGRLASAWQRYREVIHALGPGDERLPLARAKAAAIDARVPRLTIRLAPAAPADTKVSLGAGALTSASFGLALPLDPGKHQITASAPGRAARRYSVELVEGVRKELTVEPGERVPDLPRPSSKATGLRSRPERDRGASQQRTAGFVIGAVGISALITSAVTGVLVLDRKQTVDRECPNDLCSEAGIDASESGHTLASLSTIAFAVGLAGVGSGTYLVLSSGASSNSRTGAAGPRMIAIGHRF